MCLLASLFSVVLFGVFFPPFFFLLVFLCFDRSVCFCVCLLVCVFVGCFFVALCLFTCLLPCVCGFWLFLFFYWFGCLFACFFVYNCLLVCWLVCLLACLFVCFLVCLFVGLSVCLSVCLFVVRAYVCFGSFLFRRSGCWLICKPLVTGASFIVSACLTVCVSSFVGLLGWCVELSCGCFAGMVCLLVSLFAFALIVCLRSMCVRVIDLHPPCLLVG